MARGCAIQKKLETQTYRLMSVSKENQKKLPSLRQRVKFAYVHIYLDTDSNFVILVVYQTQSSKLYCAKTKKIYQRWQKQKEWPGLGHSKKECTGELSNTKRPGRVVGDRRILYMVKKKHFITSSHVKNGLQQVGMSLSKSTIKRRPHKSQHRWFTTRCKPFISLQNRKARFNFAIQLKKPTQFWNTNLWPDKTKINLYQNDGQKKSIEKAWNGS